MNGSHCVFRMPVNQLHLHQSFHHAPAAECPICLEPIDGDADAVVLGCCHRVCKECWTHWKAMRGAQAFCPLCRYSDFISQLSTISGVTPATVPAAAPAVPPAAPAVPPAVPPAAPAVPFAPPLPFAPSQIPTMPAPAQIWTTVEIGSDVTAMVAMVKAAHPSMQVVAVPEGSMMTMDFNTSRIRIFHDADMKVTRKPNIG